MQSSVMGSLMELSMLHDDIVYLTADSGEGGLDAMYRRNFPQRSYDFGIAEENMVAAAAGMALCGKTPFVYTAAPFLAYRSFEFIRDDICLQNVPVKMIGTGSGITVSSLGPTHHTTEDIAILNSLPNLTILSPATPRQAYLAVEKAYEIDGPVYIRLAMNKEEEFFDENYGVSQDGVDVLQTGKDVVLICTGAIASEVLKTAHLLEEFGISATVLHVFSIKPFPEEALANYMKDASLVVTIEEHNIIGGMGSIVSDLIVKKQLHHSLLKIGLNDCFTTGYGTQDIVKKENGMDASTMAECIRKELNQNE